jgi:PAS domain S-box-containing protein
VLDFAELFFHSPDLGVITDLRGTVLAASRALEDRLGYPAGGLVGTGLPSIAEGPEVRDFFEPGARASSRLRAPFRLRSRRGEVVGLDALAFTLRGADGSNVGWFLAGMDQGPGTEARAARSILDALVDSVGAQLWSFGPDGRILTWSAECEGYFGFVRSEAEGQLAASRLFARPEDLQRAIWAVDERGRFTGEALLAAAGGEVRPNQLSVSRLPGPGGEPIGYACVSIDVAERKRVEEFQRILFERVGEAIVVVDVEGLRVLDANAQASELFGYSREEFLVLSAADLLPPGERARIPAILRELKETGRLERRLETALRKDGKKIFVEITVRAVGVGGRRYLLAIARDVTREIQDERELREAKEFLERIQEEATEGLVLLDDRGKVVWANRALCEMRGYTREELMTRHFLDEVEPGELERYREGWMRLMAGERVRSRTRVRRKDGRETILDASGVPLERDGRRFVFSIVHDVTERAKAEEDLERRVAERTADLRQSEERFRLIAEAIPSAMAIVKAEDGIILYANDRASEVLRVPSERLPGRNIGEFYADPADRPRLREAVFRDGGVTNWEFRLRRADGSLGWGLCSLRLTTHQGAPAVLGLFADLTELRKVADALRESEERYRTLAESIVTGIWHVGPGGETAYANPEMCRLLGVAGPGELEGRSFREHFTPEGLETMRVEQGRRGAGETSSYEVELVRRDGGRRRVLVYDTPLRAADGSPESRIRTFLDVTERRRAEEALREIHEELERRVEERTALLSEEIAERRRAQEHLRLYREIFANAREGIVILDCEGRILEQNEAHRQLLGYPDEEVRQATPSLFDPSGFPGLFQVLSESGSARDEAEERAKSGETRRVERSAFSVRNAAGEVLCHVVVKRDVTARRRAEEALRESEERWRSLVDSAPAFIMTVDREGRIRTMNRLREGWRREEVVGTPIWAFAPPEMAPRMKAALEHVFATGEVSRFETEGSADKGRTAWYDTHIGPVVVGGRVVAATLVAQDITERVEAERKLAALAEEQNLLLTHSRDFIYRHDTKGVFTYVSPSCELITGRTPKEWMTHYTEYLTDHPLNRKVVEFTEETLRTGRQSPSYSVEIFHKNGSRVLLEVNERAYFGSDGRIEGVVGVARDVSERRRQEEELRFRKTLLESQTEAAYEGILVVSPEGRMISFNRRFLEMWDIPREIADSGSDDAALGSVLGKLQDPDAFLNRVRQLYARPFEESHDEIRLKDERVFDRYSAPVQDAEGNLYGRVWYFRDVTGRKRTEEELRRAAQETRRAYEELQAAQEQLIRSEKLASIGMLVSGVAHEINNPLNVIYGNLQLLRGLGADLVPGPSVRGRKSARRFRDMVRDALKAAEHARGVMEDFRSYARDVRNAELVDLNRCLEEAVALFRPAWKRRIRIVRRLGRVPPVRCLRGQLSQVFLNLLKNAAEAIEGKGVITLRSSRQDGAVRVEIQDSGRGLSPETRAKLFEPFFTTKPVGKGLGLGLSISAMIVQNHGGRISAVSPAAGGACFVVELPLLPN